MPLLDGVMSNEVPLLPEEAFERVSSSAVSWP